MDDKNPWQFSFFLQVAFITFEVNIVNDKCIQIFIYQEHPLEFLNNTDVQERNGMLYGEALFRALYDVPFYWIPS